VASALLADEHSLGTRRRELDDAGVDESVVNDDLGALQHRHRAHGQQVGSARPGAHQVHASDGPMRTRAAQ
jgi:hypothetical protein